LKTAPASRTIKDVARAGGIDVFDYLDFRALLRDYYVAKKEEGRSFSYRAFSRRVGLRSPNHLKRVTDGERNLTPAMAIRYADAMGLEGDAATYFSDLVSFNQASSTKERNAAYQRLTGSRGYRKAHKLELAHAAYHATWYVPAIREMVLQADFRPDPQWIAKRMIPPIGRVQAERALNVLMELGMLEEDADGALRQVDTVVTTGPETRGLHIANFHRAMLERASESLDLTAGAERDISSLTFTVGEDGLRRIKARVQRFRKELIALLAQEDEGERVLQLNMQLFPLTRSTEDDS